MVNQYERAYRAWPILVKCAETGRPITYGALADRLAIHRRPIRYVLGVIQDYCQEQDLPPLTIMVVSVKGVPSQGFIAWDRDDLDQGRAEVRSQPWAELDNPFVFAADGTMDTDIIDGVVNATLPPKDAYTRVKVRGMAQLLFRRILLEVYGERCALCGFSFPEALQAAHLIPWNEASRADRLDPQNGILLCSNHHRLFDAGLLTIALSGRIHYSDPKGIYGPYSIADRAGTISLHSRRAKLPSEERHRPSERCLQRHHALHKWKITNQLR